MDGDNLKLALARRNITGEKLATTMNVARRTVYEWFAKPILKPTLVERISVATSIPVEEIKIKAELAVNEPAGKYIKQQHHGKNIRKVLDDRGIKLERFARQMAVTRVTLYKKLDEGTWHDGDLLLAADILNVPVAQLKGKGDGFQAFQKDIYEELHSIKLLLQKLYEQALLTNAS